MQLNINKDNLISKIWVTPMGSEFMGGTKGYLCMLANLYDGRSITIGYFNPEHIEVDNDEFNDMKFMDAVVHLQTKKDKYWRLEALLKNKPYKRDPYHYQ